MAVIITASIVSISGIVSCIGLVVPNLARIISGADTSKSVPLTIAIGGIFALICDDLARTLLAGEIPLSILTALFGAIIFIFMISMKRGGLA
jgi:iron complex transport system permease protein